MTLFSGRQLLTSALEDFENQLRVETSLVASTLHEPIEKYLDQGLTEAEVLDAVTALESKTGMNIRVLRADGSIWLGGEADDNVQQFVNAAEVRAALNDLIIYDSRKVDGDPVLFSAASILDGDKIVGIAHLSAPSTAAEAAVRQRWVALGLTFLALTLAALFVSLYLSASLTRPMRSLQTAALSIADGDLTQRVNITRDDEIGDVGRAFNRMAEHVEQMMLEQRAFASNASHELRTPLTTMRLRVERLRSGTLDQEKVVRYSAEIEQELIRLTNLIEDLRTLSRADSNRLEIGSERVDAKRLATAVLHELASLRGERQITVTVQAQDTLPVQANMSHLRLVFRNLLENALKYTPVGGTITWSLTRENGEMISQVVDSGMGVSAEDLPNLFQRFYRVDKARNRRVAGSGLGLSLVQAVVEKYAGRVSISSDGIGHGTTTTVYWPVEQHIKSPPQLKTASHVSQKSFVPLGNV
ncbi:MAG TPA: HAMP domain-containing histidine kinase [Anaerolineae bacterium]|nr:HAMP domain-containing histidine kinase [Anaerolineae bacterium]